MASVAGDVNVFEPARFESLYDTIHTVTTVPDACVHDWYLNVERNRSPLTNLGRVRAPNEAERRDISKGVIVLGGQSQTLNADFVAQTLLLSDELHVSETYAASLLQEGIAARARWGRSPSEVACLLYYRERLALLACLKELARGTYTLCVGGDLRTGIRMSRLLDDIVSGDVLVQNLLVELDTLRAERERVRTSMQKPPSANARLSDEVQMERLTWISQAEQELGHVAYLLALARRLVPSAIEAVMTFLSKATLPPVESAASVPTTSVYLMTAVLAVFDTVPDEAGEWLAQHSTAPLCTAEALCGDVRCLQALLRSVSQSAWATPGLQHVVQLQLALFLTDALTSHTTLAPALGQSADDVQLLASRAITADGDASALLFLLLRVLSFRRAPEDELDVDEVAPAAMDVEFQEYVLQQVEHLVLGLTTTCFPLLRKLQRAEEDAAISVLRASSRPVTGAGVSAGSLGSSGTGAGGAPLARRYDIEAFFDLVALLCRGRPESGLAFWQGPDRRISRFLLWAVDTRELGQQRAFLGMLASLAEGEQCAAYAHALLEHDAGAPAGSERRLVTWTRLFEWMAHYIEAFQRHAVAVMPPDELVLLRAFLNVLATVVRYSAATRDALFWHKEYMPVDRLFSLYACAVPMDLKAAILRAIGAFAVQSGTSTSARIVTVLWERLNLSGAVRSVRGEPPRALYELENVECVHGRYPSTHALVELLSAIVPHVAPASQADTLVAYMRDASLPWWHSGRNSTTASSTTASTGHGSGNSMSTSMYVAYVLDHVLLPASNRTYARPAERWAISASCLEFAEKCLATLPVAPVDTAHPGFDVLRRLLSGTPLLRELFFFVHPDPSCAGYEVINMNRAQTPDFSRAVRAALRILLRMLEVQNDVLHNVPSINDHAAVKDRALFLALDVHLLQAHQVVVQIALYILCVDTEIAWLAVRLLGALARTSTFQATDAFGPLRARTSRNRLAGLLDMAGETARVTSGVLAWLEADTGMDADSDNLNYDADVNGNYHASGTTAHMDMSSSLSDADGAASLNDTATGILPAKIQKELLDLFLEQLVPDAPAPNVAHLLLGFDMDASDPDRLVHESRDAILLTLVQRVTPPCTWPPTLAERCYAVLQRACVHPYTSASMLRFLRTHDFVATQLRSLPLVPLSVTSSSSATGPSFGTLMYASGETVSTRTEWALALLRTHAHILSLVALELHTLAAHGQLQRAVPLMTLLLGEPVMHGTGGGSGRWRPLLEATHVTWENAAEDSVSEPKWVAARLAPALVPDTASAARVYDIHEVAALLLEERGTQEHTVWFEQARRILLWAAAQNTRRAFACARREAFIAWRQVMEVLVGQALTTVVRADVRVPILLDCANALLPRLQDQDDALVPSIAASTILSLLHAVREHEDVPAERLVLIVRAILDVLSFGTQASTRCDLYLSLVCAQQLVCSRSSVSHGSRAAAAHRVYSLFATHATHLVNVLARDALDGSDVAQTVSLTTLSHLVAWDGASSTASSPSPASASVLPALHIGEKLASAGFLKSLALRIHELDVPLQATLTPDPPSLNALYVYEALLSVLGRLARSKASLLLEARIVDVLARVDFPSLRPEHTLDDMDGFLPPVAERYASLLMPLLQLLVTLLMSVPQARESVHAVLVAHQDAFLAALHAATHSSAGTGDVEQAALLVQILTFMTPPLLPTPPPFHAACLALAATYLVPNAHEALKPLTPAEREDASIFAPTYNGLVQTAPDARLTLFDASARRVVDRLARALVQYMELASSHGEARAILVPSMHVARVSDHASSAARIVAAPSLGVAIAALGEQCASVALALSSLDRVNALLRDPESVHADEWTDMAQDAGLLSLSASSALTMQCRAACEKALDRVSKDLTATVLAKLDMIERWLVMLVRHLDLFMRIGGASRASFDAAALRSSANAALLPILDDQLAYLTVPSHLVPSADEHVTFLHISARRVAERLLETSPL